MSIGLLAASTLAVAQAPIRIGEINSYSAIPQFTQPYRQGWQLAVEQINASMRSLDQIAENNASATDEITATVMELARIADATRDAVSKFTV